VFLRLLATRPGEWVGLGEAARAMGSSERQSAQVIGRSLRRTQPAPIELEMASAGGWSDLSSRRYRMPHRVAAAIAELAAR
jgi:hypothetical protein